MKLRQMAIAVLASLFAGFAWAEVASNDNSIERYALIPDAPDAATPLSVRVDIVGCVPVEPYARSLSIKGTSIAISFEITDYCLPNLEPRSQLYPIGTLPAGTYDITYSLCAGLVPPGVNPCREEGSEQFVVAPGGIASLPRVVPALSTWSSLLLVALLAVLLPAHLRR